jgi:hypothetical protein
MLDGGLTAKEREIVGRLARRFPSAPLIADIREVQKPKGPVQALHLSWAPDLTVDIERGIIAWPNESALRIVEAVEAQLEIDGLVPSPYAVPPGPRIRTRMFAPLRMSLGRLTSLLTHDSRPEVAPGFDSKSH